MGEIVEALLSHPLPYLTLPGEINYIVEIECESQYLTPICCDVLLGLRYTLLNFGVLVSNDVESSHLKLSIFLH